MDKQQTLHHQLKQLFPRHEGYDVKTPSLVGFQYLVKEYGYVDRDVILETLYVNNMMGILDSFLQTGLIVRYID